MNTKYSEHKNKVQVHFKRTRLKDKTRQLRQNGELFLNIGKHLHIPNLDSFINRFINTSDINVRLYVFLYFNHVTTAARVEEQTNHVLHEGIKVIEYLLTRQYLRFTDGFWQKLSLHFLAKAG